MIRAEVGDAEGFLLYAVHLGRPTFGRHDDFHAISFRRHRADALRMAAAAGEGGSVVIAGDLDLCDRTSGYAELSRAACGAMRVRWARSSYTGGVLWGGFALRIDRLAVSRG